MEHFIGTYECKIDSKGRLKIPSHLVKQMKEMGGNTFIVKRSVFQKCLEVYPLQQWEKIMVRINKLNRFVKKNADFIRMFTAGVKVVEMDKTERMQVSKDLTTTANLKKEIVIASAGEFFEIWDKNAYEKAISIDEMDFANLAEEVMGNIDLDEN